MRKVHKMSVVTTKTGNTEQEFVVVVFERIQQKTPTGKNGTIGGRTLQLTRSEVDGDGAAGGLLLAFGRVAAETDEEGSAQDGHCFQDTQSKEQSGGRRRGKRSRSEAGEENRKRSGKEK